MRWASLLYWTIAVILQPACLFVMLATFADLHVDSGARQVAARAQINAYLTALQSYKSEVGSFPTEKEGLNALRNDAGVAGWSGPYVDKDIGPDPWGRPYLYRSNANSLPEILSLGAEGQWGGEGIDADISSLELSKPAREKARTPAAYLRTVVFMLGAIGFFGYPFLPSLLRRVSARLKAKAS